MSLVMHDVVKEGHVKFKGRTTKLWHKRWIVLKKASSKGPNRIEKYADYSASRTGNTSKLIHLTSISTIDRTEPHVKKSAVKITFTDGQEEVIFACDSEAEAYEWVLELNKVCSSNNNLSHNQTANDSTFSVYLLPSTNLDLYGECMLQVSNTAFTISLYDIFDSTKQLIDWPLGALRRYGHDSTKFTFESGRHCETGEGNFIFNTREGGRINECVRLYTEEMRQEYERQALAQQATRTATLQPLLPQPVPGARKQRTNSLNRPLPPPPTSCRQIARHHNQMLHHVGRDSPLVSAMSTPPSIPRRMTTVRGLTGVFNTSTPAEDIQNVLQPPQASVFQSTPYGNGQNHEGEVTDTTIPECSSEAFPEFTSDTMQSQSEPSTVNLDSADDDYLSPAFMGFLKKR